MIHNINNNNLCFSCRILKYILYQFLPFSFLLLLFLICSNNTTIFAQQSNSQSEFEDINIVVAGDFYCNDETEDTIENIISINPELIITTGDHVKDEISVECWIEMSKPIKDKMKIAIGNHDTEFTNIYKQIVGYHNIKDPYYSHDFQNVHFISMSTEHPFEEKSEQYGFIKNDLEKTSQNKDIDWIIIHQHKPFYSTHNDRKEAKQLRDTFLPLFEKYSVDLIIYGHNQYYERTYPILYNKDIEDIIDEETMPQPIITDNSSSNYKNTKGIKFLTVGTGGDKLSSPKATPSYLVIQNDEEYGFLNLKLEGNGKTIVGEFQTNDGDVIDSFTLQKS